MLILGLEGLKNLGNRKSCLYSCLLVYFLVVFSFFFLFFFSFFYVDTGA